MSTAGAGRGPAIYELTVAGELGAVFGSAVRPHEVVRSEICTVLRARASSDTQLADLVLQLEQQGLNVDSAFCIDP